VIVHGSGVPSVTLVLAVTGVVLSLLALGWQWYSFVFISGSRVRVQLRSGLRGIGAVVTHPSDATPEQLKMTEAQGFTDPVFAVVVNNTGRGATSVTAVELAFSNGGSLGLTQLEPALPFRLEGEYGQTWYIDAQPAFAFARATQQIPAAGTKGMTVRGRVTLGNTKTITSKNSLAIG
jgi:hypothetical protein